MKQKTRKILLIIFNSVTLFFALLFVGLCFALDTTNLITYLTLWGGLYLFFFMFSNLLYLISIIADALTERNRHIVKEVPDALEDNVKNKGADK